MKIKRRISVNLNQNQVEYLNTFNIEANAGLSTFYINDQFIYERVKAKLQEWFAVELIETKFTKDEMESASNYAINALWHNDYPQPESTYIEETYNTDNFCEKCGIGLKQKDIFKIRKEVNWRNEKIMHLNWVFDEFFVPIHIYNSIFKSFGIEKKEVFIVKENKISKEICQLIISQTDRDLEMSPSIKFNKCSCGRKKYFRIVDNFFPSYSKKYEYPIFKTKEYFGSGHYAYNQIIISKNLYNLLKENNIKLLYTPLAHSLA